MSTVSNYVIYHALEKLKLPAHIIDSSDFSDGTRFVEDIGVVIGGDNDDSLPWLEFIMALENKFKLEIPEEDYGQVLTVGSMTAYIEARVPE